MMHDAEPSNGSSDVFSAGMVPTAVQHRGVVVEQRQLARDTWLLRVACPGIARQIVPGQFFMVRAPGRCDPLLGRPFALFDVYDDHGEPAGIDFGYVVVGKLTSLMTTWKPNDNVDLWGPLGNGFPIAKSGHLMFVAGGIGQTPFLAAAREALGERTYGCPPRDTIQRPSKVSMIYGVRSADYLAGLDEFRINGLHLTVTTDDGSHGLHGFVTDALQQSIAAGDVPDCVYSCGPEPMMKAVAELCARHNIECWLSLETPMACGFGACFSCVTRVKLSDGSWDYKRTCVEGPVFRAEQLML